MEDNKDKILKISALLFIIVSVLFVIYATITMRGMYLDGGFYLLAMLEKFSQGDYSPYIDFGRTRFCIMFIMQMPVVIADFIFRFNNKYILMMIFSCVQFLFPLLALWWNYELTKRTKRYDILFWSLFNYGLIILPICIFSVLETPIGATLHFILWNYLAGEIKYNRKDIILIILLLITMIGTWEYVVILGPVFFIASFVYSKREENPEYKLVKRLIGNGALFASIFDAIYIMALLIKDPSDGSYFIKELYDFWPQTLHMCSLFSIVAILILIVTVLRKTKILYFFCAVVFSVFSYILVRLLLTLDDSLSPMWESHIRSVEFWFLPLIFFCIFIWDLLKKKADIVKMRNCIIIVLLCGVFQTVWQCIHCYFWDVNVQYMKTELKNTEAPLYIPSEHYEISSFFNPWFRRYIWWGNYAEMSILFSDTYKIKTLLVNYDFEMDEGNKTFRKYLYTIPESKQISIPYGGLNIAYQNKFWDITKPAEALHKYNEEHNIITADKE